MHPLRAYLLRFVPQLTESDWQPLAQALRPRHLARGAHFVQAGEHRPKLALVLSGSCRLYYPRPDGEERTTYFFFENHLLADYPGCLTGRPSQFGIQVLTDTELVVFDYALLRRLYDERPVYERFGRLVAEYHLLGTDACFPIVHDRHFAIMTAYHTAFTVDAPTAQKYRGFGVDLQQANGAREDVLPVPATYVIGRDGRVKFVYFNPDYKQRASVRRIAAAL